MRTDAPILYRTTFHHGPVSATDWSRELPVFPSVEWFECVRRSVNEDQEFRSLGSCDATVGVKVGERVFALEFEAFECSSVAEIEEYVLADLDFYLEMEPAAWESLLTNIRQNSGADSDHTFNSLDVDCGVVKSANPYGLNSFLRYHLSIQRFFDLSSSVDVTVP